MLKHGIKAAICGILLLGIVTASTAGDVENAEVAIADDLYKPVFDDRLNLHLAEVVIEVRDAKGQKLDPKFLGNRRFWNRDAGEYQWTSAEFNIVRHLGDYQMIHDIEYLPKESQFVCRGQNRLMEGDYTLRLNLGVYGQRHLKFEVNAGQHVYQSLKLKTHRSTLKLKLVDSNGCSIKYVYYRPMWWPYVWPKSLDRTIVTPEPVVCSPIPRGGTMGIGGGGGRGGLGGRKYRRVRMTVIYETDNGWMHIPIISGIESHIRWKYSTAEEPVSGESCPAFTTSGKFEDKLEFEIEQELEPKLPAKRTVQNSSDVGYKNSSVFIQPVGFRDPVPAGKARVYYELRDDIAGDFVANYNDEENEGWLFGTEAMISFNQYGKTLWADIEPKKQLHWGWDGEFGDLFHGTLTAKAGSIHKLFIDFKAYYQMTLKLKCKTFSEWANCLGEEYPLRGKRAYIIDPNDDREPWTMAFSNTQPGKMMWGWWGGRSFPNLTHEWKDYGRKRNVYYKVDAVEHEIVYPKEIEDDFTIELGSSGLWLKAVDSKGRGIPFAEGTLMPLAVEHECIELREALQKMQDKSKRPNFSDLEVADGNEMLWLNNKNSIDEIAKHIGKEVADSLGKKELMLRLAHQGSWYDPLSRFYSDASGYMHIKEVTAYPVYERDEESFSKVAKVDDLFIEFDPNQYYVLYLWSRSRDDLKPDRRIVFKGAELIDLGVTEMPGYVKSKKPKPDRAIPKKK